MVIPSLADAEKVYEFLCPAVLIEPDNVWPQSIGVWARTIKGDKRIAAEIKMKILKYNLDSDFIFQPSIPDACLSLKG
jgi:hypothetical protein